jgi:hypothetical protein
MNKTNNTEEDFTKVIAKIIMLAVAAYVVINLFKVGL